MERSYRKIIGYVKKKIADGKLSAGEKLPPERELAEELEISRNSVREGLRVLENMGVLDSHQGAGNFVTGEFDELLAETLSFMYILKKLDPAGITTFRHALERGAVYEAVRLADADEKKRMAEYLRLLEAAGTEEERAGYDRAIHTLFIDASRNICMIANYRALDRIMDEYIPKMREKIAGSRLDTRLAEAHRLLACGFCEGDAKKAVRGLELHLQCIREADGDYEA